MNGAGRRRGLKANHNSCSNNDMLPIVVFDIAMNGANRRPGLKANHNGIPIV
jgi:hypothetical protein